MAESVKSFLSGGFGGMCVVFVGHPLDTIKVRLMTDTKHEFKGAMDCFRKTIARDGFFGLYAGMSAPLVAVTPIFAVYFWGFDKGKDIAAWAKDKPKSDIGVDGMIFAGGFSAIPGTMIMVPGDLLKVKLQVERNKPAAEQRFTNPINCAQLILKEEGPAGLFKGTALTLLRDVPGSVAYYTTYELLKEKLKNTMPKRPDGSASPLAIMLAGGFSGVTNWLVAVPPDVLKSRYQAAPVGTYPGGLRQVARELFAQEGAGAFFKGLGPALVRAFPANAACFLGMEVSRKAMDKFF
jgi:solute carrier family 25 carnitine/acylcarnitine transporter 20/29